MPRKRYQAEEIIPEFSNHRTLQLSGHAEILWHIEAPNGETGGACRYREFTIAHWVETEKTLPGPVELPDYSAFDCGQESIESALTRDARLRKQSDQA